MGHLTHGVSGLIQHQSQALHIASGGFDHLFAAFHRLIGGIAGQRGFLRVAGDFVNRDRHLVDRAGHALGFPGLHAHLLVVVVGAGQ